MGIQGEASIFGPLPPPKDFGVTDDVTFPEHPLIYVKYYGVRHLSVPPPLWFCVFHPDSLILYA